MHCIVSIFYNILGSIFMHNDDFDKDELIEISEDGTFTCVECENVVVAEVSTENGMEKADIDKILKELSENPLKTIYCICPVCGMEYQFVSYEDKLYLLPSDEEK